MDHLAIPVPIRSGRGASSTRRTAAAAVRRRLFDALRRARFALVLGPADEPVVRPDRAAVLTLRDRLAADGVELVEQWDELGYVSVKCRDPDGYVIEAFWEPVGPRRT